MNKTSNYKTFFMLLIGITLITAISAACTLTPLQAEPATQGGIQRVTLEDSKAAFDSNEAVFLDVRSTSSFAASHIPSAVSIPLSQLDGRIGELDPNQWIITYCT